LTGAPALAPLVEERRRPQREVSCTGAERVEVRWGGEERDALREWADRPETDTARRSLGSSAGAGPPVGR